MPSRESGVTGPEISETSPDPDAAEVSRLVHAGAGWSLTNNLVIRLGTLLSGIVLARLLTPTDYGVYAVALVVLSVLLSMNELGVGLAIVRWDRDIASFAPTVMTLAVASSIVLYGACYALAPSLADLMNAPQATGVLRLLCILVIFDGISTVPSGILTRRFMQARRFIADVSNFALGTTVTIILAVAGAGAMSLAVGQITGGIVGVVLMWIFSPIKIRPGWNRRQARELVDFGLPLAGASLLVLGLMNVDYIVVGRTLGPGELGLYLMAFNLSSWPVNLFGEAARRVSFAGFSRLANRPEELGHRFQRGIGMLGAATVPVCALLAGYARPLIEVLYGERWVPAAAALQILAVLGLLRAVYFIGYDALVAVGDPVPSSSCNWPGLSCSFLPWSSGPGWAGSVGSASDMCWWRDWWPCLHYFSSSPDMGYTRSVFSRPCLALARGRSHSRGVCGGSVPGPTSDWPVARRRACLGAAVRPGVVSDAVLLAGAVALPWSRASPKL